MPQYFDRISIEKMYGLPGRDVSKIMKLYKDVIKPSIQSTDVQYYSIEVAELINEIYYKTIIGKFERQIREELKLPQKKEKKVKQDEIFVQKTEVKQDEKSIIPKAKEKLTASSPSSKNKGVNDILFDLFKARIEEYLENGLITRSQLSELIEFEKSKLIK